MQHQVDSQVSFVQVKEINSVRIVINQPTEPSLSIRSSLTQVYLKDLTNPILVFPCTFWAPFFSQPLSFPHQSAPVSATLFFALCRLSLFFFLSLFPPLPTPTSSAFFSFYFVSCVSSCFSPPTLLHPHSVRDKFVEVDLKPVCKHCYERLPDDMRRRLAKRERDSKEKKKKPLIPMCLWCSLSICPLPLLSLWSVSFSFAFLAFPFPASFILFSTIQVNTKHVTIAGINRWNNEWTQLVLVYQSQPETAQD